MTGYPNISIALSALEKVQYWKKRSITIIADVLIAILVSTIIQLVFPGASNHQRYDISWELIVLSVSFLPIFWFGKIYRQNIRYVSIKTLQAVGYLTGIHLIVTVLATFTFQLHPFSLGYGILQPALFLLVICGSRVTYSSIWKTGQQLAGKRNVLIYGAGEAGVELASALAFNKAKNIVGFLDDDLRKQSRSIMGHNVYPPKDLKNLIGDIGVDDVYLAMPSLPVGKRVEIANLLNNFDVRIRSVPSLSKLDMSNISGQKFNSLPVDAFLGRPTADFQLPLCGLENQIVLVTGAGGSIGSEISRQLVHHGVTKLLLLDNSEFNLFNIDAEIQTLLKNKKIEIEVVSLLCDIRDADRLEVVIAKHQPDQIYHTAAYKHVPICEQNAMEALRNNFEATSTLVELAKIHQVKKFVLISSDKAVRPTNIMGATKRLAEISVQAEAAINDKTIFAIVRFGNVIGSSGSAIPIFQNQIENGGPITVTHPDISRYFMSIDEAVALVLQAGEMAQRSEVFVLDMGHPIKILDVVKRMVKANGKSLKTPDNPSGEIEIMFIGLRPGEKLFEELVLGTEVKQTKHDKILCANETYLEKDEITKCLYDVKRIIEAGDNQSVRPYLENLGVLFQFKVDG